MYNGAYIIQSRFRHHTMSLFAVLNQSDQLFDERVRQALKRVAAEQPSMRSRTASREYSTLPTADCDEVKLWDAEVKNRSVRSFEVMLLCCFNTLFCSIASMCVCICMYACMYVCVYVCLLFKPLQMRANRHSSVYVNSPRQILLLRGKQFLMNPPQHIVEIYTTISMVLAMYDHGRARGIMVGKTLQKL